MRMASEGLADAHEYIAARPLSAPLNRHGQLRDWAS
jgi:hypothetical protein